MLTRPLATTLQDATGFELDLVLDQYATATEAVNSAWIAPTGTTGVYADIASYTCIATGPTDTAGMATDRAAIQALMDTSPTIFTPGTYYLGINTVNGIKASLFARPNLPVKALINGTVTISWGNNIITGQTAVPGVWCVITNYQAGTTTLVADIHIEGILFTANAANQGTGIFDVYNASYFSRVDRLRLWHTKFADARATGGATSTTQNVTVTSNGTNIVTRTSGYTVVAGDIGNAVAGGAIGNAGTTTVTAVAGNAITLSAAIPTSGAFTMQLSNSGSFFFEKWNCQLFVCHDPSIIDFETYSTNKASYGATGLGIQYSTGGICVDIDAHDNKYHGSNNHSAVGIKYTRQRAYLNNSGGSKCEYSRDIHYDNCSFGGETSHKSSVWDTTNTSLGNGADGLTIQGAENCILTNCDSIGNGGNGITLQATTDATEGPGLQYSAILTGITLRGNGDKNLNCINGAGALTKITCFQSKDAPAGADIYINGLGQFAIPSEFGGLVPAAKTVAVPAANTTTANPYPFTMQVIINGGTGVIPNVDGVNYPAGATLLVQPGQLVGLGNYTGTPTWQWIIT